MKKKYVEQESIDDTIDNLDLTEKSELGQVADQIFKNTPSRSNISDDEMVLLFVNNAMFKGLGKQCPNFKSLSPVDDFLNFKKSVGGWNTEQFVRSVSGVHDQRNGGVFSGLKDKLFGTKE